MRTIYSLLVILLFCQSGLSLQDTFPPYKIAESAPGTRFHSLGGFSMNDTGIPTLHAVSSGNATIFRGTGNNDFVEVAATGAAGIQQIVNDPVINAQGDVGIWTRTTDGENQIHVHHPDGTKTLYLDTSGFLTGISNQISISDHHGPTAITLSRTFYNGGVILARSNGTVTTTLEDSNGDLESFSSVYSDPQGVRALFRAKDKSTGKRSLYIHQGSSSTKVVGFDQGYTSISGSSINTSGRVGYIGIRGDGVREIGIAWQGGHQVYANDNSIDLFGDPAIDSDNSLWTIVEVNGVDEIRRITPTSWTRIVRVGDSFEDGTSITSLSLSKKSITEFGLIFKAGLDNGEDAICIAPKHMVPRDEDRVDPIEIDVPPTKTKLALVTHGWTPDPAASEAWVNDMVSSIAQQVGPEWEVKPLIWTNLSSGNLVDAHPNGVAVGINTANDLIDSGQVLDEISIKGHSASAGLLDAFCREIKQAWPDTTVTLEYLDAFEWPGPGHSAEADISFHYFTDGPIISGDLPFTNSPFPNSHNVNLTLLDGPASHAFPRIWYQRTITDEYEDSWLTYGWQRASAETGNANAFVFPQDGRTVSLVDPWFDFHTIEQQNGSDIDFDTTEHETSQTGTVTGAGSTLNLQTQSPAWWLGLVTLDQPRDCIEFEIEFLSGNGAEGQLIVEFDGKLIGSFDERFISEGTFRIPLFGEFEGPHQLAFRLDPYSSQSSLIRIKNVHFGTTTTTLDQHIERGDLDGSGVVNNADISAMVLALIDRPTFEMTYPLIDADINGDMNADGVLNFADINLFVARLLGN